MKLSDNEIIEGYISGGISGITVRKECLFMPVRITGLGVTLRVNEEKSLRNIKDKYPDEKGETLDDFKGKDLDLSECIDWERVDRNPSNFDNLENYQGLPILREHPADGEMLNLKNFKDNPIIGTITKVYSKDGEIWGIAKIYDLTLLDELNRLQSTSPAIISAYNYSNFEKNGIIEEMPNHFNHLAFVEKGHWDQISEKGYDANDLHFNFDKEVKMTDNTETRLDKLETQEKKEGQKFEELAKEHQDEATLNTPMDEVRKEVEKEPKKDIEDSINPLIESKKEAKDSKEDFEEKEAKDSKEDFEEKKAKDSKEDFEEKEAKDSKEEIEDSKECLTDEEETILDEERWALIKHFRDAKDRAHRDLNIRMPHIDSRLNPSATISRILNLNAHMVDAKYANAIDSEFDRHNYRLQVDAFNDMLGRIEKETERCYRELGKAKHSGFVPTEKDYIQVDKNF